MKHYRVVRDCCRSTPTLAHSQRKEEKLPKRLKVTGPAGESSQPSPLVNGRFRRWAIEHVSWEKVLIACGYDIIKCRTLTRKGMAAWQPKPSGDEYYIHCPYHIEKTASLHLSPYGFHCFGCSATGNKVTLVVKMQRLRTSREVKQFFAAASELCKE